jgi:hypothetical protein
MGAIGSIGGNDHATERGYTLASCYALDLTSTGAGSRNWMPPVLQIQRQDVFETFVQ